MAIVTAVKKRATYQDVLQVPPHRVAEVLDGDLYVFNRPASAHGSTSSVLGVLLGGPFQLGLGGPGGWRFIDEPELHFGECDARDIVVPDLAGWRRERMPERPTAPYLATVPDWICEVLSPTTASVDRVKKMPIYAREGVKHAWLIDPLTQTVEAFELVGARWTVASAHSGAERVRVAPFAEIELDLQLLFEA